MNKGDSIAAIEKRINVLMAENKVTIARLCDNIGMTANGYSKMWKNKSIKVETIQRIADYFKVPLSHFFDGEYPSNQTSGEVNEIREKYIQALESENELLKKILKNKTDQASS